jgi:hypothetical protein
MHVQYFNHIEAAAFTTRTPRAYEPQLEHSLVADNIFSRSAQFVSHPLPALIRARTAARNLMLASKYGGAAHDTGNFSPCRKAIARLAAECPSLTSR